jgi:uncharacterized protein YegP (UPF0339 family)
MIYPLKGLIALTVLTRPTLQEDSGTEYVSDRRRRRNALQATNQQRPQQPYYFEIQASGNFETLVASETYVSKADAERAINLIQTEAAGATVADET